MKSTLVKVAVIAALMMMRSNGEVVAQSSVANHEAPQWQLSYAVTVNCGFGRTSINIHNPHGRAAKFTKQGVPFEAGQESTPPNEKQQAVLNSDWAQLMSCDEIAALGAVGSWAWATSSSRVGFYKTHVSAIYTSFVAGGGVGETRFVQILPISIRD